MKKEKITQILRHLFQAAAFVVSPGLFVVTLSAVESIYKAILSGSFSLASLTVPLIVLATVIPITALWGRFFCGWLCAFGSTQELIGFIGRKLKIKKLRIGRRAERIMKGLKYAVLLALFILWSVDADLSKLSPWNVFGVYSSFKGWSDLTPMLTLGGAILLVILVASLFFERGFCRWLCPLSGVFSGLSIPRLFKIKKNSQCVSCGKCSSVCPMGIDVCGEIGKHGKVKSGECIDCFRCVDVCHAKALYTNPKEAVSGTLAALAVSGVYLAGTALATGRNASPNGAETVTSQGRYTDGVYTGSAHGYRGETSVSVTVENGNIVSVTIESHGDDDEFFDRAKNEIIGSILTTQSTDVSAVSGATFSSEGIINAVKNALDQQTDDDLITEITSEAEPFVSVPETTEDHAENNPDELENNTEEEQTGSVSGSAFESLTDGVYTGTGSGRNGDVKVSVTVENGKVVSITVISSNEDAPYMSRAEDTVLGEIIEAQSIDVRTVSGATMSSNGIIDAVADALSINFDNPNGSMSSHGHGEGNRGRHG